MIGTLEEARRAVECEQDRRALGDHFGFRTRIGMGHIPDLIVAHEDGWSHMGAGCDRSAWRSPSNVTYKVADYDDSQSSREWDIWQSNQEYTEPTASARIPFMHAFFLDNDVLVIAVETIFGTPCVRMSDETRALAKAMRISDLHSGNVVQVSPRQQVIIDLGIDMWSGDTD